MIEVGHRYSITPFTIRWSSSSSSAMKMRLARSGPSRSMRGREMEMPAHLPLSENCREPWCLEITLRASGRPIMAPKRPWLPARVVRTLAKLAPW